jgi:hypothetical protein
MASSVRSFGACGKEVEKLIEGERVRNEAVASTAGSRRTRRELWAVDRTWTRCSNPSCRQCHLQL